MRREAHVAQTPPKKNQKKSKLPYTPPETNEACTAVIAGLASHIFALISVWTHVAPPDAAPI